MKNKLKSITLLPDVKRRMGDFVCNFTAVVLGILITFAGSHLIEKNKTKNEIKDALLLVKNEMLLNRENIVKMMNQEISEQQGAFYLLQYKDSMAKASPDSLEKYGNLPFATQKYIYINDAMEMLKTSSLMPSIRNKELVTQIIRAYNTIKGSYDTFDNFMETKKSKMERLTEKNEVQRFMTDNANSSFIELWNFLFKLPDGVRAVQQIAITHSYPQRMYGRYLKQIDETIAAIDEIYR